MQYISRFERQMKNQYAHTQLSVSIKGKLVTLSIRLHVFCLFFLFLMSSFTLHLPCSRKTTLRRRRRPMHLNWNWSLFHWQELHLLSNTAFCCSSILKCFCDLFFFEVNFSQVFFAQTRRTRKHWTYLVWILFWILFFMAADVLFATCFNLGVPLFTLASRIYW